MQYGIDKNSRGYYIRFSYTDESGQVREAVRYLDKAGASVKGAFMVILPEDFGRLSVPVDGKYPLIIEPNLMTMKQELEFAQGYGVLRKEDAPAVPATEEILTESTRRFDKRIETAEIHKEVPGQGYPYYRDLNQSGKYEDAVESHTVIYEPQPNASWLEGYLPLKSQVAVDMPRYREEVIKAIEKRLEGNDLSQKDREAMREKLERIKQLWGELQEVERKIKDMPAVPAAQELAALAPAGDKPEQPQRPKAPAGRRRPCPPRSRTRSSGYGG